MFFNLTGCILWYIIPYCRRLPLYLSRQIGSIVSEYRWFAFVYIFVLFFFFPFLILFLALIHWLVAVSCLLLIIVCFVFICSINYLQNSHPNQLPFVLRSWAFLPRSCRSLAYWDSRLAMLVKSICCLRLTDSNRSLKEQYLTMKDQYLTALDYRFLSHTNQLNQLFEKHHAPIIAVYESRYPITYYVEDFYRSLTGKISQSEKILADLKQNSTEKDDELIDRIIVFDREKNKHASSLSF